MCYWLIKERRCWVKKVIFARRLQGLALHCCSGWSCCLPCLALRRRTSKHRDCESLCSRTPSHLQLWEMWRSSRYRDVPPVVPAIEDIPAGLPSQAHPSGAPPGSLGTHLCHASIPPHRPPGQEDLSSDPALESCCHQGVPFPLQWDVVAVPSLPFQWEQHQIPLEELQAQHGEGVGAGNSPQQQALKQLRLQM